MTTETPNYFMYFPSHCRWSAEILAMLSTAPYGGAQHCQRDYLTAVCDTIGDWLADKLQ
jgi:hypothetical protein